MPTILACLPAQLFAAAHRAIPDLVRVTSLAEVRSALRASHVDGLICDPAYDSVGGPDHLFWLASDFPNLNVIVYTALDAAVAQSLLRLASAGVTDVVLFGYEDTAERWEALMAQASARDTVTGALRAAERVLAGFDAPLRFALQDAFYLPRKFRSVDQLAAAAGTNRRAIYRRLHGAGIRAAREWIDWGRVMNACALLRDPALTPAQTARLVGYADGGDLARHLSVIAGYTIDEARIGLSDDALVARMSERLLMVGTGSRRTSLAAVERDATANHEGRRRA